MATRFRWTRRKYMHAHHLARLLSRLDFPLSLAPAIVQRYWALWERHPALGDPLMQPPAYRYSRDDIPF